MIKSLNVLLFFTSILALAGVYVLKYQTETIADEKRAIVREIVQHESNLSILEADWAYLTQPSHVEPVVGRHAEALELQIVSAQQFGSIQDIPMRPVKSVDEALAELLTSLDEGIDPIGDKLSELLVQ